MIGDLHCHTKLSDGSTGLEELISSAKRAGLDCLAVTDHDTIASLDRSAVLGKRYGVYVMPGVEFSCYDRKRDCKVHILCYLPRYPRRLQGTCLKMSGNRDRGSKEELKKVMRLFPLTPEQVSRYAASSSALYRQHIMHALMDLGYTDRIFGDLFQELFGKNGCCKADKDYLDVHEVTALIKQSGGIACMAHPLHYGPIELLEDLTASGEIQALEVYNSHARPGEEEKLKAFAAEHSLIATGGTDFHGYYSGTPNPVGSYLTLQPQLEKLFTLSRTRWNET